MVFLLVAYFCILYVSSEKHLSLSLLRLAEYLKLSPQIAGLTLLAFGNGAPDFFTALTGSTEKPAIVLGASIGSGLFITLLVLGSVIISSEHPIELHKVYFLKTSILYLVCTFCLLGISLALRIPLWLPIVFLVIYVLHLVSSFYIHRYHEQSNRDLELQSELEAPKDKLETLKDDQAPKDNLETLKDSFSDRSIIEPHITFRFLWHPEANLAQRTSSVLLFPINVLCWLSIPPLLEENNRKDLILYRVRLVLNPWFSGLLIVFTFNYLFAILPSGFPVWAIYVIVAATLSILLFFTTSFDAPPKYEFLVVLYSFVICILWIYAISNEVILILGTLGIVLNIRDAVLGLTVLSWGNSIGDLVANVSVAKSGAFETAIMACIGGPVQNVLLTLGVSFIRVYIQGKATSFGSMESLYDVYIGLGLLILHMIVLIAFVCVKKFHIPKSYGYSLLLIYAIYMIIALVVGLGVFTDIKDPL
jgi:sodium/potassium/calcium exchanger 6